MVGVDKLLHFFLSFGLTLASNPLVAATLGVGKEVYDSISGGVASAGDLIADGLGIIFGMWISPFF
ncbi:MAG: hypothetical protein IT364_25285 [Candidatus Hydrogenedentes bacterium]|nr:hypothetical protein [Candidatus Hydrogenedentota bacterium]